MGVSQPSTPVLQDLIDQLGRQRQLVEYLLFKLTEARLLLSSGQDVAFVPVALGEIEGVLDRMREEEQTREKLISLLAEEWAVESDKISLGYLVAESPEPYRTAFAGHKDEFMTLVDQIEEVTKENRRLAAAGLNRVQSTISGMVEDDASTYSREGRVQKYMARPMSHDKVV